ncbi:NERD domain-containing protein [Virgibacillus byunsanensis]|uniref:NERD domain-containing protein n=1 Tax=Virgibacillus byunsanensis TaxID=570945 RepID=A0ABW3LMQ2_9BACI
MTQLIKLQDYITRYEWDIYRYPSQFIRLKQDNWKKLHYIWSHPEGNQTEEEQEKPSYLSKWKSFMKRKELKEEEPIKENSLPKTEEELKQYFLNKLFPFQLKWASSTVTDVSFFNSSYYQNDTLKYFLQRFPDTYLLMYYPIFNIKKAPVDGEVILISPIGIEIIQLVESHPHTTFKAGDERTWEVEKDSKQTNMLSPMIALKRTEQIVKSLLHANNIEFPITKVILSRTNHIIYSSEPYKTKIFGKQSYEKWFQEKRTLVAPLKNRQLKAAEILLKNCQTTAVKRPEWEEDTSIFSLDDEEV